MQKPPRLALVIVLVALSLGGLLFYARSKDRASRSRDGIDKVNASAVSTIRANVEEIKFERVLIIENSRISIDGAQMTAVPCSQEEPAKTFAKIKLSPTLFGELECLDNYMGGISIVVRKPEPSADPVIENLGRTFADAGELSDTRTWITRSGDSVRFQRVTLSSLEDLEDESRPPTCQKSAEELGFDPETIAFFTSEIPFDKTKFVFDPTPIVDKICAP